MTPFRSRWIAMAAVVPLIGAAAMAADEQFPHGLMASGPGKKGCVIETRPLSFGNYDPLSSSAVAAQGQVIYTCGVKDLSDTQGVKNIRIEFSRGSSNSYATRRMTSGDDALDYNVYLDATHRTIWGDGSDGTDYYFDPHPPNKTPVTVPAFGQIRGMQDVAVGQYVDSLQVTILF
jgi:spore coat protein U-like protein